MSGMIDKVSMERVVSFVLSMIRRVKVLLEVEVTWIVQGSGRVARLFRRERELTVCSHWDSFNERNVIQMITQEQTTDAKKKNSFILTEFQVSFSFLALFIFKDTPSHFFDCKTCLSVSSRII